MEQSADWIRFYDEQSGQPYLVNMESGESKWEGEEEKEGNLKVQESLGSIEERTKDYEEMAREYRQLAVYRDYQSPATCSLCSKGKVSTALFPCGHACICDACRLELGFFDPTGVEPTLEASQLPPTSKDDAIKLLLNVCPVCAVSIRRILSVEGEDGQGPEERYWAWVVEAKPLLPERFERRFQQHAASYIEKVYLTDEFGKGTQGVSSICSIS